MQWTGEPNGGFSTAPASRLVRPLASGDFGPRRVNVADQHRDPDSQLSWMRRLIRLRRETPELGWGSWRLIESRAASLCVHRCDWQESTVIAAHNLGPRRAEVTLKPDELGECEAIDDLFEGRVEQPRADGSLRLALDGYGYRWLRLRRPGQRPRF
jgi:glycosidase